ncbi:MAG: hypothetical protein ACR2IK_03805 [Chloroflexota bacterium]
MRGIRQAIVVTGPTGQVGAEVIAALRVRGLPVRATAAYLGRDCSLAIRSR